MEWKRLSKDTVSVETVNTFKGKIEPIIKKRRGQTIGQRGLSVPVVRKRWIICRWIKVNQEISQKLS